MREITPVLLAGGSGTRLWPLSRKTYPKQFAEIFGNSTLFQQSALRLTSSEKIKFSSHITVTNSDFRFIVTEQLQEEGIDPGTILIEPQIKNTAPAILAASLVAQKSDPNAVLLVAPSDHLISDKDAFHAVVSQGIPLIEKGYIVTFGISPTHPETGYGYLETTSEKLDLGTGLAVSRFVEKPDLSSAQKMIDAGNFLWNAGIFLFRARDIVDCFRMFAPKTLELVAKAVDHAKADLGFLRLQEDAWTQTDAISVDYAIMEHAKNLVAIPFKHDWTDLGGWDAVWSVSAKDKKGNATTLNSRAIDCVDTLLRSENSSQQLVGLGLKNVVAIAMHDAVLIADKGQAQNVKTVVELLKQDSIAQAEDFPKEHRPWGWFESLSLDKSFQVKRIVVKPGGVLSLQSHKYRSEHWVVVEGCAKVTIDDEVKIVDAGQSVYVPLGSVHRMENPGLDPMTLIEVQIGSYFGEDDIVRYEDIYARDSK